jgi:RecA/RadA recombinase
MSLVEEIPNILKPYETGIELLQFINNRKPITTGLSFFDDFFSKGIKNGEIIEIRGTSNSGKSEILLNLICNHLLPLKFGGFENSALLLDCDGKFSIFRLVQLLQRKILNYSHTDIEVFFIKI